MNQPKSTEKPFAIPKQAVVEAFKKVKENTGSAKGGWVHDRGV